MYYYDYYPFWAGFFYSLGIELVTSSPTNRGIMEAGLKKASDDTCLPIKVLVGHLQAFKGVDAVFIPRLVSVEQKTYLCPKILGLPESVLGAVPEGIPVLTLNVNMREGRRSFLKELEKFGVQLGKSRGQIHQALSEAYKWLRHYEYLRKEGWDFEESISCFDQIMDKSTGDRIKKADNNTGTDELSYPEQDNRPTIALVGHSYLTYENYSNMNLLQKLKQKANLKVIENVKLEEIEAQHMSLRKKIFWSHAKKIFGAGNSYVSNLEVDGIIYLSCFGCGTDSLINDILARNARISHKPYMVITLDEHTGEAGVVTRLEAFVDMIERRLNNETNLSSYGECLDRNSSIV